MNSDEEKITQLVQEQQKAWNSADAAGYAQDCDENISLFRKSQLEMSITHIHFPQPNVAIVDIRTTMIGFQALPNGVYAQADGMLYTSLLEILVRNGPAWRVVAYHNVDIKNPQEKPQ